MRAVDSAAFSGISATTAAFPLTGGEYQVVAIATAWNSGYILLAQLGPDGSTWLSVTSDITSNGGLIVNLPPGQYQFQVSLATGVSCSVVRIPGE